MNKEEREIFCKGVFVGMIILIAFLFLHKMNEQVWGKANAQVQMSAQVSENLCNTHYDVISECCSGVK